MKDLYQYLFENVNSNKLNKQIGAQIIKKLSQLENKFSTDIAIIGMSVKLPMADNTDTFWDILKDGVNCISEFPQSRRDAVQNFIDSDITGEGKNEYCLGAYLSEIDEFDYKFFKLSPIEANLMDPGQRVFLQTAFHAIEDAGYGGNKIKGKNVGVFLGYSNDFSLDYKRVIQTVNPSQIPMSVPGNIKSIIASRISYILDLKGPSMLIDTACSSALTATHLACRSIRSGECEMAIAGGIKLNILPLKSGGQSNIGIESSDGIARTFDDSSDGTGIGEGIMAILIKPYTKALEDDDNIYAVIKGTAINQDGSSIGITAPNAFAQKNVIISAWKDARIDPNTITYMEAHGTGTPLGDPIEADGMEGAFRQYTNRNQFCAVGSVKTNIGHLDNAAGMAGLIKAVLSLQNKEIPPSLHLNRPNRKINFESSPVFINDRLTKWETEGFPRRCGVSSFGLSGTNSHVVLEEAPYAEEKMLAGPSKEYIFTLSAKGEESLIEMVKEIKSYIKSKEVHNLEGVCYTISTGRGHYTHRMAIIADKMEALVEKLEIIEKNGLHEDISKRIYYGIHKPVSVKKNMESKIEITDENIVQLSREAAKYVEKVAGIEKLGSLEEELGYISKLYINGAEIDWETLYVGKRIKKVSLPTYAFVRNKCWVEADSKAILNNKIQKDVPHPLIDLCLVECPDVEVYCTKFNTDRHWVLNEHRVNGICVVPGTTYLEIFRYISSRNYNNQALEMQDVVFLSPLAVNNDEFRDVRTQVKIDAESIEFVVSEKIQSGEGWIKYSHGRIVPIEQENIPVYELADIRQRCPVKGQIDVATGAIETGPRWDTWKEVLIGENEVLAYFELNDVYREDLMEFGIHPALMDCVMNVGIRNVGEGLYLPFSYRSLKFYSNMPPKVYSYIKKKDTGAKSLETAVFDVILMDEFGRVFIEVNDYAIKKVNFLELGNEELKGNIYYETAWINKNEKEIKQETEKGSLLVFLDETGKGRKLVDRLKEYFKTIIEVEKGTENLKTGINKYIIDGSEDSYMHLLQELRPEGITKIIHLMTLTDVPVHQDISYLNEVLDKGIYSLYGLSKALIFNKYSEDIEITLITNYAYGITGTETNVNPHNAAFLGLGKVLNREHGNFKIRAIDIDDTTGIDNILNELRTQTKPYKVAYRQGTRLIEEFRKMKISEPNTNETKVKANGVYVITGGTGGLGLEIGRHLAKSNNVRLCILSRSGMPERENWSTVLEQNEDLKTINKIEIIMDIESMGSDVSIFNVDISDFDRMKTVLDEIRSKYGGAINGVIHCAGNAGNGFIMRKDRYTFEEVIAPKIQGTWVLDKLTRNDNPDFFIMFSSIATLLGEAGQGDYAAANSYMDSFTEYRKMCGLNTLTINWAAWKETGMAVDYHVNGEGGVFKPLTTSSAVSAFDLLMNGDAIRAIIGELDFDVLASVPNQFDTDISDEIKALIRKTSVNSKRTERSKSRKRNEEILLKGKSEITLSGTEIKVAGIWARVLGLEEVDIYESFNDLGGDSILATTLLKELDKEFQGLLDISDIFSYSTVNEMSEYIDEKSGKRIKPEMGIEDIMNRLAKGEITENEADRLISLIPR